MEWERSFSLTDAEFTDVVSTFKERFYRNQTQASSQKNARPITRFYIDELDVRNEGQNLRTQLTCFLAATGVGKTHAARWIGRNACLDGLNVLHFQLEGSRAEVETHIQHLSSCAILSNTRLEPSENPRLNVWQRNLKMYRESCSCALIQSSIAKYQHWIYRKESQSSRKIRHTA